MKKTKDLLNYHAFGTDPVKGMSQDYNKPLIIPAWSDSFLSITNEESGSLDIMKHHFTTHFPQSVKNLSRIWNEIKIYIYVYTYE